MGFLFLLGIGLYLYLSFGIIQYYIAPEDVLPVKTAQGLVVFQVIISIASTVPLFIFLSNSFYLEESFGEENWKRILFFLCLLFICFFAVGLFIELFIFLTDKEYRMWRKGEDKIDHNNNQNN